MTLNKTRNLTPTLSLERRGSLCRRSLLAAAFVLAPATVKADPLPVWQPAPNHMLDERWAPAYCLLADGRHALIAGGFSYSKGVCVDSADIYDERRHRFVHAHGHLKQRRDFANANLLPDGTVLISGGYDTQLASLDTAELYVPRRNRFEPIASKMSNARELFTATTLRDGRVLCAGGLDLYKHGTVDTADLYDPSTRTFTAVSSTLAVDRFGQTAILLPDGRVLIAGGKSWKVGHPDKPLASAEIFDPSTGLFHRTKTNMSVPRDRATSTLLADGTVFIAGGQDGGIGPLTCEIFDPKTETFTTIPAQMHTSRMAHSAAMLSNGRILFAGGWSQPAHATTATVEIYDPSTFTFAGGPPLPVDAHDFAMIQFPDGLLLVAGGKRVDGIPTSIDTGCTLSP